MEPLFEFEKEIQFGAKGRADCMYVNIKQAVIHGEMSPLKFEIYNLTGTEFSRHLDLHA